MLVHHASLADTPFFPASYLAADRSLVRLLGRSVCLSVCLSIYTTLACTAQQQQQHQQHQQHHYYDQQQHQFNTVASGIVVDGDGGTHSQRRRRRRSSSSSSSSRPTTFHGGAYSRPGSTSCPLFASCCPAKRTTAFESRALFPLTRLGGASCRKGRTRDGCSYRTLGGVEVNVEVNVLRLYNLLLEGVGRRMRDALEAGRQRQVVRSSQRVGGR